MRQRVDYEAAITLLEVAAPEGVSGAAVDNAAHRYQATQLAGLHTRLAARGLVLKKKKNPQGGAGSPNLYWVEKVKP